MLDMIKSFSEVTVQCDFSRRFVLGYRLMHSSLRYLLIAVVVLEFRPGNKERQIQFS